METDPARLQFLYQLGLSNLQHFSIGYDSFSILKMTLLKMIAFSVESQKKNLIENKASEDLDFSWPRVFKELNLGGISKNLLKQASLKISGKTITISFSKNTFSILNDDQKKDIEKSFNDFFKQKFEFIYDDKVVKNDTPEKEEKAKEKGLKRNIKKNMTKDKNFNEILDGLKVESVKFMKKNET